MIPSPPPRPDLPPPPGVRAFGSRPRATWQWYEAVGVFLIGNVLLGQLLAGALVLHLLHVTKIPSGGATGPEIAATIAIDLMFLGVMLAWLMRWHPTWRSIMGLPTENLAREAKTGFLAGLVLYPAVAFGVGIAITVIFRAIFGQQTTAPEQIAPHLSAIAKVGSVALAILVAPVVEELFFRGSLFRSIRDRRGFWPAAIVTAVLFGLSHYVPSPWQDALLLQTIMIATGFGLAWIYEQRGSLVTNIVAHATFNVIGIVLILTTR